MYSAFSVYSEPPLFKVSSNKIEMSYLVFYHTILQLCQYLTPSLFQPSIQYQA